MDERALLDLDEWCDSDVDVAADKEEDKLPLLAEGLLPVGLL